MSKRNTGFHKIPLKVVMKDVDDVESILRGWGIRPFGGEFGHQAEWLGWQTVDLPRGWKILLEGPKFLLVDNNDQVRGEIRHAFRFKPGSRIDLSSEDGRPKKRWRFKPPELHLFPAITSRNSFSCGEDETYNVRSFWYENPLGERLYGEYDVRIPTATDAASCKELQDRVNGWMQEHYPDWKDPNAYWSTFL